MPVLYKDYSRKTGITVDFAASNFDRGIDLYGLNSKNSEYERAMHLVGTILEKYDSDGHIPVYGFGESFHNTGISRAIDIYKHMSMQINVYAILLIINDDIISDLINTIEAIINATIYPLSILIVGV
ncbi:13310_t:CDS:2 [Gigaspora rosea]|nr:13310_t:CDS:2 [Gigaspora rosea]